MQTIKAIFWNENERRVRAGWRILGQLILFVLLLIPLQGIVGSYAISTMTTSAEPPTPAQVQQMVTDSPVLLMLATVATALAFLGSVWAAGRYLGRRRFAGFGFHIDRNWWADFAFGLALGAVLMVLIFVVEFALGWVTITDTFVTRGGGPFAVAILLPLGTFLAVGFYEELSSRGFLLQNLAEGLNFELIGPRGAIVIATLLSSALFGIQHAANPNATFISTFNIFLAGVTILALGYVLTGELAIPIGVHITWNFVQGNVFGFPVSGIDYTQTAVLAIEQGGPTLWTGGAFGPEAGVIGIVAMLLGSLLIAWYVKVRYGRVGLQLAIAEAPAENDRTQ